MSDTVLSYSLLWHNLIFQATGQDRTKKQLQEFYGRKLRAAKQKGDAKRLRDLTTYSRQTGGGAGLIDYPGKFRI
jgi:hypothetical protein